MSRFSSSFTATHSIFLAALLGACLVAGSCSEPQSRAGSPTARSDARSPPAPASDASSADAANVPNGDEGGDVVDGSAGTRRPVRPGAPALCAREGDDAVRDIFCGKDPPKVESLSDLQDPLELNLGAAVSARGAEALAESGEYVIVDSLVALAHSTALSGQLVSPINPRALILGPRAVMAFQRGVQKVELIAVDRGSYDLNFYLVEFRQACNEAHGGCRPGDLYTSRIERDWQEVTVRDDDDLKNTPQDCRQCHQRGLERAQLLIREINGSWSHFFAPDPVGVPPDETPENGRVLVQDFLRARGDEPYGNVPAAMFRQTAGLILQNLATDVQPLLFHSDRIEEERWPLGPSGYPRDPARSATWDEAYDAFKRGEQLALPHHSFRPVDPEKLARLSDAYVRHRKGELPAEELPDLADVFPDDPQVRAEIGLQTEPGAAPVDALIQACASCHNDVLDQTVTRARFNVALDRMSREQRELAIARIELPRGAEGVMPPPEARQLEAEAKRKLLDYLRLDTRPDADEQRLRHAAEHGMRGGGRL